jgi:hypothetical protein
MSLTANTKDTFTTKIRQIILEKVSTANETDRAGEALCTLSFQSKIYPERQIWIDTDNNKIAIDLEDWDNEIEWDNAVARFTVDSVEELIDLIRIWLDGFNLEEYYEIEKEYQKARKIAHSL